MIKWGQKSKPQKIPQASNKTPKKSSDQNLTPKKSHAKFPSHKNFLKALNDITQKIETLVVECLCLFIHHTIWELNCSMNLQTVWNTQKNPYLNQATQKNTWQNFRTQKNPEIKNFNPQLKSFDHPCHLKSRVTPWGFSDKPNILLFDST